MATQTSSKNVSIDPTLLETCEPLFQYLAWLSKLGRGGASGREVPDEPGARRELMRLFRNLREKASGEVYDEAIERSLWAFADGIASECKLPWAQRWEKRGFDPEGNHFINLDQDFWDFLGATLAERPSEARLQRLEVFAACIGFGYDTMHFVEPEYPQRFRELWAEIGERFEDPEEPKITPQAYEGVNDDVLPWDPRVEITRYLVVLGFMLVALVGSQVFLFYRAQQTLRSHLVEIEARVTPQAGESDAPALPTGVGDRP